MLKLIPTVVILLCLLVSCTSLTAAQGNTGHASSKTAQPAFTSKSTQASQGSGSGLDCVRSINEFGKPTQCRCASSLVYNPITGNCEKGGRMCTMSLTDMFNEKTGQCYTARNGCEAGDLKSIGWRPRSEKDQCK